MGLTSVDFSRRFRYCLRLASDQRRLASSVWLPVYVTAGGALRPTEEYRTLATLTSEVRRFDVASLFRPGRGGLKAFGEKLRLRLLEVFQKR